MAMDVQWWTSGCTAYLVVWCGVDVDVIQHTAETHAVCQSAALGDGMGQARGWPWENRGASLVI